MWKTSGKRYRILFFLLKRKADESEQELGNGYATCIKRKRPWLWFLFLTALTILFLITNERIRVGSNAPFLEKNASSKRQVCHIAFLKVHKAGGSSIQNILFRFGSKRNLTFIIPVKGGHFSHYGETHESVLDPVRGSQYDILAMHSVFNATLFSRFLPKDTLNIGIVREPLDAMISAAFYHRDVWKIPYLANVPKENFIQNLVRYPELYDKDEFSLTKNFMAYDFGFPRGIHIQDTNKIQHYLDYLGRAFHFVMVTEHFSESLVLMRRLLNWNLPSILHIPVNAHAHTSSGETNISDIDRRKFKDRNFLDIAVYNCFYDIFMTKISNQTNDFFEEVKYYNKVQTRVAMYCLISKKSSFPLVVNESEWNERFLVTPNDCDEMKTSELEFIEKLRNRHIKLVYANL